MKKEPVFLIDIDHTLLDTDRHAQEAAEAVFSHPALARFVRRAKDPKMAKDEIRQLFLKARADSRKRTEGEEIPAVWADVFYEKLRERGIIRKSRAADREPAVRYDPIEETENPLREKLDRVLIHERGIRNPKREDYLQLLGEQPDLGTARERFALDIENAILFWDVKRAMRPGAAEMVWQLARRGDIAPWTTGHSENQFQKIEGLDIEGMAYPTREHDPYGLFARHGPIEQKPLSFGVWREKRESADLELLKHFGFHGNAELYAIDDAPKNLIALYGEARKFGWSDRVRPILIAGQKYSQDFPKDIDEALQREFMQRLRTTADLLEVPAIVDECMREREPKDGEFGRERRR